MISTGHEATNRSNSGSWTIRRAYPRLVALLAVGTLALLGGSGNAGAAPGQPDPSFGGGDGIVTASNSCNSKIKSLTSGKVLVLCGSSLLRYQADGTPDTSFGGDGSIDIAIIDFVGQDFVIDSAGKIVVAGETEHPIDFGSTDRNFAVSRLNADGTVDTSFGGGDGVVISDFATPGDTTEASARTVKLGPGGTIIAGGYLSQQIPGCCWFDSLALAKYTDSGSPDNSFSGDGKSLTIDPTRGDSSILSIDIEPDGSVIAGSRGGTTGFGGDDGIPGGFTLTKYNADGSLNPNFGNDGFATYFDVNTMLRNVVIQPDGKILAVGSLAGDRMVLARFNADGSLDPEFGELSGLTIKGVPGFDENTYAESVALQPDGRIVIAGGTFDYNSLASGFVVARFNPDGWLDPSFGAGGIVLSPAGGQGFGNGASSLHLQTDGNILVSGDLSYNGGIGLLRLIGGGPTVPSPPQREVLSVAIAGNKQGDVTSSPSRLICGGFCQGRFTEGESVTLAASPYFGADFTGWTGAGCSGTGTCQVTMDQARSVTATFTEDSSPTTQHPLSIVKAGDGQGAVNSNPAGIDCGTTCTHSFDEGTTVTLTAAPTTGSRFTGWTGDCTGTGSCQVSITSDRSVTATFAANPVPPAQNTLTISRNGTGTGSVISSPAGIECGATCSKSFDTGTPVQLTATPVSGSKFTGWSGACSGTTITCQIDLGSDKTATATFDLDLVDPPPPVAPKVTITAKPSKNTKAKGALFKFKTSISGATFKCQIDKKPFAGCKSPKTYKGLKKGSHSFKVKATAAGLTGDAASYSWKVSK